MKSWFLDSIWKGNNHSKCKNKTTSSKLGIFQTYALAPAWGRLLTPKFRKIWNSLKFHEIGRCSTSSSAILHFPSSKKSIQIYVLKHKSMLQIDFGPKSWFSGPKSLRGLRTGTRFGKSWFKNRIFKIIVIPCRFRGQNHGNSMEEIFKSLGRGCQTERVLGAKCENGLPKTSRNLVHVMKK